MAKLNYVSPNGSTVGLIFAHPDRLDVVEGSALSTRAGRFLKHTLYETGIKPSDCFIDYLLPSFPGRRGLSSIEAQDEMAEYNPALRRHISDNPTLKVLILFGPEVLPHFNITDSLTQVRGFVFDQHSPIIIPTFNPSSLFTGMGEQIVTFQNDLEKAASVAREGFSRPPEKFWLSPTVTSLRRFLDPIRAGRRRIYVDIEAVGSLNERDRNEITMIGVGDGTTGEVMVVPFLVREGGRYWSHSDEEVVRKLLQEVLQTSPCVFHNAEYDCKHLNYQGFGPVRIGGDTMLLHHALHPELPHSLAYVTSVYGNIPYWKATLKKAKHQLEIDNIQLRTYNARDCLAMMQIEDELIEECKEQDTYSVYEDISILMLDVVLEMNNNGLPVDATKLVAWRQALTKRNESILDSMSKLWKVHPAFNWDSGQHLGWLFYGESPPGLVKKRVEYSMYFEPENKKKKTTKKFAALKEYCEVFDQTSPFRRLSGLNIKSTTAGKSATDNEMRGRIREAIIRRVEILINAKTTDERREEEQVELAAMRQIIDNMMEYAENAKLLSTYTKLHIEPDGRVHPGYRVSGTKTGRLSSYSPNGQNIPPEAKKIFVAPPGWKFISFDFTNLELVVLAYIAGIPYLIDVFKRGLNVHDENTKRFLGVDESNPKWEEWRRVMKMYVFGRNYGGSLKGMYRRMLTAIPGLQMTFKQFEELDRNYFKLMPEYREWYDETVDTLRRTRTLRNAFNRIRIFLGPIDKVAREGLNFPIQGTAADIMAFGLIDFYKVYRRAKAKNLKMQLCLSVHDSAVLLAPEREILVALKMLKNSMCSPRTIGDTQVAFLGDVKISDTLKGKKKIKNDPNPEERKIDDWLEEYERRKKQAKKSHG